MRRFDRAVFAVFLLVLLADVARAHASVPVSGDPAGNLILTAAAQLSSNTSGGAVLAIRRSDGSLAPIAHLRRNNLPLAAWSRILAARSSSQSLSNASHLVLLATSSIRTEPGTSSAVTPEKSSEASSLAIFAHTLSPAP